jgi:hypothetical protein
LNDQEIPDKEMRTEGFSPFPDYKKKQWKNPRVDLKKQILEITNKLTACVSQG